MRYLKTLLAIMFILALCGRAGAGLEEGLNAFEDNDYATALTELKPLADQGSIEAQNALGKMYNTGGAGLPRDDREAVKWFRKAALQRSSEGQLNLGIMYAEGMGVKKDIREALKWYRKSAAQRNTAAQYRIGEIYENGVGVKRSDREALKWFRMAAEGGNPEAMRRLGEMYERGKGVPKDNQKAREWYERARKASDTE